MQRIEGPHCYSFFDGNDAFGLDSDLSRAVRLVFQPVLVVWALWSTSAWSAWRTQRARDTLALIDARADRGYVYVIDDKNVAHRRAVSTSGIDRGDVLVLSGLEAGERVIAEGAAYVRDGEAVVIADRP